MFANGTHIRTARTMAGLDQAQLAEAASLHRNSIHHWEKCEAIPDPEPFAVSKIRKALQRLGVVAKAAPYPFVAFRADIIEPTAQPVRTSAATIPATGAAP
jgi:transcriptional regulator with XRE-family HTH domain